MKKNVSIFVLSLLTLLTFAQAPEMFNYQGVARNVLGEPLANKSISLRISILVGSVSGSAAYVETHSLTTNVIGLYSTKIGEGVLVSGSFSAISWGANLHFIQIEINEDGGSSYVLAGTQQLMSVPYALYANTADSIVGGEADPLFANSVASGITTSDINNWNTNSNSNQPSSSRHFIGEQFGGGVIFHLTEDSLGNQHGLIVGLNDLGEAPFGLEGVEGLDSTIYFDGQVNTNTLISAGALPTDAAGLCANSSDGGYTDWFLPSGLEMEILRANYYEIQKHVALHMLEYQVTGSYYLTSYAGSSYSNDLITIGCVAFDFINGNFSSGGTATRYDPYKVRAVRAF